MLFSISSNLTMILWISPFNKRMIWAQQIMLGKKTFAQVPRLLKEKVREVLIDSGCEDLVTE